MSESSYPLVVFPAPEEDGGGFVAYAPDLPGCMSYGDTAQEAVADLSSAIGEWIDEAQRLGREVPAPGSLGVQAAADRSKLYELVRKQDALIKAQDENLRETREELDRLLAGVSALMLVEHETVEYPSFASGSYRSPVRKGPAIGRAKIPSLHS